MVERATRALPPWAPVALVMLVAAVVLIPGLGEHGLLTDAELPVLDRARAALGASLSDLERSPWLPDLLRTHAYDAVGGATGLRLPHALAVVALVAMAAGLARRRGATTEQTLLVGALTLAFPAAMLAGRTVLGNPIGEALATGTVLAGLGALVFGLHYARARPDDSAA
ncbi:MAG: hypothetical protein KDK70_37245, partial [Myxococcales bacterium]|nr:hypothetical protein [Myxococcales bacterium]